MIMLFKASSSNGSLGNNLSGPHLSSPEESMIDKSNYTTRYYDDRPSHRISNYTLEEDSEGIFDIDCMKTYTEPVDSKPVPILSQKEVLNLKKKFNEYKQNIKEPREISPRPIIKSPLGRKKSENRSISPLTPIQPMPSYKKPLLSLSINLAGREYIENVCHGEYSVDVAKRIFSQANIGASQQGLKNLSELIQNSIRDYMAEVSLEIAKFYQNSKKIETEQSKHKFDKFKPPLLATERRANEKRQILGSVSININGQDIVFPVKEGDIPEKLAETIRISYKIPQEKVQEIIAPIKELLDKSNKKFLFRIEFDVNGKIVEVAVHEGDDLSGIATRFVRENKLGRENISKIEEILKKQAKLCNT
ncbi:hypothetical protein SteCoe_20218 [Stentor coeruleus]|uniref:Uncharacterized protein n=1 Tax=Stentor coeruleus TaxID=5963 RepID=A0A1R2BS98_9CILI|nr:hypothetical protein SteCoe_20218 [Stentor coeruleus]